MTIKWKVPDLPATGEFMLICAVQEHPGGECLRVHEHGYEPSLPVFYTLYMFRTGSGSIAIVDADSIGDLLIWARGVYPDIPVRDVFGLDAAPTPPFFVDTDNSDDNSLYVDVFGKGTVVIKNDDDGIVVDIFPLHVADAPVASTWARMSDLTSE